MRAFTLLFVGLIFFSCQRQMETPPPLPKSIDWDSRSIDMIPGDSVLEKGKTYLSVYSDIYRWSEEYSRSITATISIRNVNSNDSIYLFNAEYYNTEGELIKSYLDKPAYIGPMETVEIVIHQDDKSGGTGANFVFDWGVSNGTNEPFFEGVMISLVGTQGFAFTTQGLRIE